MSKFITELLTEAGLFTLQNQEAIQGPQRQLHQLQNLLDLLEHPQSRKALLEAQRQHLLNLEHLRNHEHLLVL